MTSPQETKRQPMHPEGLTPSQEKLADLLFTTKTRALVNRRQRLGGRYNFYKMIRLTSPVDFPVSDEEFALKLHESKPEAPLSPIYINLRNLPEKVLNQVGVVLSELTAGDMRSPDLCTGIPNAGIPLAEVYSKFSGIKVDSSVFEKKEDDDKRRIVSSSSIGEGKRIRIIDDLATEGGTKLETLEAAEEMGYQVEDIVVVLDRQQGATQLLAEKGFKLRAAFTLDQLLKYGLRTGRLSQEGYDKVKEYITAL